MNVTLLDSLLFIGFYAVVIGVACGRPPQTGSADYFLAAAICPGR